MSSAAVERFPNTADTEPAKILQMLVHGGLPPGTCGMVGVPLRGELAGVLLVATEDVDGAGYRTDLVEALLGGDLLIALALGERAHRGGELDHRAGNGAGRDDGEQRGHQASCDAPADQQQPGAISGDVGLLNEVLCTGLDLAAVAVEAVRQCGEAVSGSMLHGCAPVLRGCTVRPSELPWV